MLLQERCMRIFRQEGGFVWLVLAALLCSSAVPCRVFADDKESSTPAPKSVPARPDSPAPLTERERWMLDRMEQLEKRVAELESKGNPPVTPATEVSPPQSISPNLSTSSLPTGAISAAPAAVASTNVIPTGKTFVLATAAGAADMAPVGKDDVDRFGEIDCGGETSVAGVKGGLPLDSSSARRFSSCSMRSSIQRSRSVSGAGESGLAGTDFGAGVLDSLSSANTRQGTALEQSNAASTSHTKPPSCLKMRIHLSCSNI